MSLKIEQLIVLENGVILREDYHYIGLSSEYSTWMYLLNFMSHKEFKEIYSRLQGKVELPQLESLMELLEHHNQLVNQLLGLYPMVRVFIKHSREIIISLP